MRCKNCTHYDVCYQYDIIGEDDSEMCALYERKRPHGEWEKKPEICYDYFYCSKCGYAYKHAFNFCPNCGASMQANDRQVTGKLDSETEYKAKVKELEDAIAKCERAEKEFKSRTCKFRSPINCDFCAFHSECEEHWKEGDLE